MLMLCLLLHTSSSDNTTSLNIEWYYLASAGYIVGLIVMLMYNKCTTSKEYLLNQNQDSSSSPVTTTNVFKRSNINIHGFKEAKSDKRAISPSKVITWNDAINAALK